MADEIINTVPKPTWYNNYYFRSKLEAKWAVFFDSMKIRWTYEPEAFVCEDKSQYTPDFFLSDAIFRNGTKWISGDDFDGKDAVHEKLNPGIYIEIKPISYDTDEHYEKRIVSSGISPLILLVGDPIEAIIDIHSYHNENKNIQLSPGWDNCMIFMYCLKCKTLKFDFDEGNYYDCPICGRSIPYTDPQISNAAEFARNFRFQFYDPRNK
jgi:hypothetical protein